jgi:hypothetical protein
MTEIDVRPDRKLRDLDLQDNANEPLLRAEDRRKRRSGAARFGSAALLLLAGGLAVGGWRHYQAGREVAATAEQARTLVPVVRVATVRASDSQ